MAKTSVDVSMLDSESVERLASDLATDRDTRDTLSFVPGSANSSDSTKATVTITGDGKLKITGVAAGNTAVTVKVTDGKAQTSISIPVEVTP
ncbi:hypothetical protein [Brevibacillus nitrificans]|uniref:hypothetical protein n=1 Tax=Brevibacillus nitrificans TaxID=651560 RepID=UPI003F4D5D8A